MTTRSKLLTLPGVEELTFMVPPVFKHTLLSIGTVVLDEIELDEVYCRSKVHNSHFSLEYNI